MWRHHFHIWQLVNGNLSENKGWITQEGTNHMVLTCKQGKHDTLVGLLPVGYQANSGECNMVTEQSWPYHAAYKL